MEQREFERIEPGMDVYDRDSHKLGTVAHVHDLTPTGPAGGAGRRGYLEVATGLLARFGLGRHLFVPLEAVRDVTPGGLFLTASRAEVDRADWHTRPADLERRDEPRAPAQPASGAPTDVGSVAALDDWEAAAPHYRRRWEQHYGQAGARWETYEPRYRFAWDMARLPAYAGRDWVLIQSELRDRWDLLHLETEWDTVADTVRDAWEHVAGAPR
jgi:hypothetical protein